MAGHSKFKNIMHRKGKQDAARSKAFMKCARDITIASRGGLPDPAANPRLRLAIATARAANLPKDRIERAIAAGQPGGDDGKIYEELRYEGFGPGRVALILDITTDNRNRTAAEIRSLFSKNGGNMGETNSVSFMFERKGEITYPADKGTPDAILEAAIEAGADDAESDDETHTILTAPDELMAVAGELEKSLGEPSSCKLIFKPTTLTAIEDVEAARSLMNFIDKLEEHDDVDAVHGNYDIPDDIMAQLEEE